MPIKQIEMKKEKEDRPNLIYQAQILNPDEVNVSCYYLKWMHPVHLFFFSSLFPAPL
jgi:hypothetical protein